MKNTNILSRDLEALQTRFALRVASRQNEAAMQVSHDVDARLRFARERALERARTAPTVAKPSAPQTFGTDMLTIAGGSHGTPWWARLASLAPLVVLLAGLTLIQQRYLQEQIEAAAEIDAALLADDLPPTAYSDPGFGEYLKFPQE
jgi:hypothetical protein